MPSRPATAGRLCHPAQSCHAWSSASVAGESDRRSESAPLARLRPGKGPLSSCAPFATSTSVPLKLPNSAPPRACSRTSEHDDISRLARGRRLDRDRRGPCPVLPPTLSLYSPPSFRLSALPPLGRPQPIIITTCVPPSPRPLPSRLHTAATLFKTTLPTCLLACQCLPVPASPPRARAILPSRELGQHRPGALLASASLSIHRHPLLLGGTSIYV